MNLHVFTLQKNMIFYAPRLPADPPTRSECIRSFVYPLRALQAPCLGTTLGGTHPQRTPPPGTPPRDPPHPTPTTRQSEWKAIPSGWLFQVDGFSECMAVPRGPTSTQHKGVLRLCFGGVVVPSVQPQRSAACKDLAQEHPKSSPSAPKSTPRAPSST